MEEARHDVLAYMSFHKNHWSQIRSTNPLERLNRESKRPGQEPSRLPDDPSRCGPGHGLCSYTTGWGTTR